MNIALNWLETLLRWGHVIAGIAWVGTSFYFNWFDLSTRKARGEGGAGRMFAARCMRFTAATSIIMSNTGRRRKRQACWPIPGPPS